jgi:multicomponent Na+:H+ antiporter subunit B
VNDKRLEIAYIGLVVVMVVFIATVLFLAVMEMPVYGEAANPTNNYVMRRYIDMGAIESGGANLVANVVLDYRGYDTLLETTVIFTAVISIMVLWGVKKE